MRGIRLLGLAVLLLLAGLLAPALSPSALSAAGLPLRYGETISPFKSIFSLPILVGERQGFFAREGLDFQIVPVQGGGEASIDALNQDDADVSHVATSFLIKAALKGSDAVAIAAEFNNPVYSLISAPGIRDYADLKGKLIAMADESGTVAISMRRLLSLHGLKPGDYRETVVEGTPSRLACLRGRECDAAPLGQPQDFFALKEGFHRLGVSNEAVPAFVYTVTAVNRSWAKTHRETLVRYVRGLAAAFRFIRDPARRDDVVATIRQVWGSSEESARQTLSLYFDPDIGVLPKQGEIDLQGVAQVLSVMAQAGTIPPDLQPDRFVDLSYLQAAGLQ